MLHVKIRAFVLLRYLLEMLILAQTLQEYNLDHQSNHKGACDSMLISYAETMEGKPIIN